MKVYTLRLPNFKGEHFHETMLFKGWQVITKLLTNHAGMFDSMPTCICIYILFMYVYMFICSGSIVGQFNTLEILSCFVIQLDMIDRAEVFAGALRAHAGPFFRNHKGQIYDFNGLEQHEQKSTYCKPSAQISSVLDFSASSLIYVHPCPTDDKANHFKHFLKRMLAGQNYKTHQVFVHQSVLLYPDVPRENKLQLL